MRQRFYLILIVLAFFANSFGKQIGIFVNSQPVLGQINSLHYCCDVAGFPYVVFSDVDSISTEFFDVIFLSAVPVSESSIFGLNCNSFVTNGGFLFGDRESVSDGDSQLYSLFGLSGIIKTDVHKRVYLSTEDFPGEMRWLDDELEEWFQLCRSDKLFYNVNELIPDAAAVMAVYEDSTVAITENRQGAGRAYCIGMYLKHTLLFPRMNKDMEAQRTFSNGFDPGADVIPLLFRGIIETHFADAGWKYTVPTDAEAVVCITHDMDSKTALEEGYSFADYEKSADIVGQYNMTTRYFRDDLMSAFYLNTDGKGLVKYVLNQGHIVSSHSVGHFYDMTDISIFATGDKTVTRETYNPYHLSSIGITVGGTIYGEALVSKQILEDDGAPTVNSIRTGHLCFPKYLPEVLEDCGYLYSSCLSSNDVMTCFPLWLVKSLSSSNPFTNVMEVPMHLSDVFMADPISSSNWPDKVNTWLTMTDKFTANNAPIVLLIHPNREFKLEAQKKYFKSLPMDVDPVSFIDIAEFWVERTKFRWTSYANGDTLLIKVPDELCPIDERMRIMLPNGDLFGNVRVEKESGTLIPSNLIPHKRGLLLEFKEAVNNVRFIVNSDYGTVGHAVVVITGENLSNPFTNADGRLDVKGLPSGSYDFTIMADGHSDYVGSFTQERKSFVPVTLLAQPGPPSDEPSINVYFNKFENTLLNVDIFNMDMPIITVFSLDGRAIKTMLGAYEEVRVDVSDLDMGVYLVMVRDDNNIKGQKFIVK